jgi:hypothetical protein
MLPVTHGRRYTQLMIVLYTVALVGVTLLPFAIRMSGYLYLAAALVLGATVLLYTVQLFRDYSAQLARATFKYSIWYLAALGAADRSLLALMARSRRRASCSPGPILAGCAPDAPSSGLRRHRYRIRPRFPAHRPHRKTAHARGFPRQDGRAVLRLHAVSRRMPHDAFRAGRGDEAVGSGCGPRAGAVRHRRSGARHAGAVGAIRAGLQSVVHWSLRRRRRHARTAKEFRIVYQKQPGSTPGSYTMDHSAGTFVFDPQGRLRLTSVMVRGPTCSRTTSRELLRASG